ncbi:MAG TPA: hypothetical protein VFE54_10355, partial [Mucilaginibacter sp.]|nr:hypothetical protein [Mucilaginibacter sp.]
FFGVAPIGTQMHIGYNNDIYFTFCHKILGDNLPSGSFYRLKGGKFEAVYDYSSSSSSLTFSS